MKLRVGNSENWILDGAGSCGVILMHFLFVLLYFSGSMDYMDI